MMSEVFIAERKLKTNGTESLSVVLYKPEMDNHPEGDWKCDLKIGDTVKNRYRVDAFRALLLSLELIHAELDFLREKEGMSGMNDLGFNCFKINE